MQIAWGVFLLLVLLDLGCVKADMRPLNWLVPRPVEQVEVLTEPPQKPFKVIGHVVIRVPAAAGWDVVLDRAQEKAAALGGDAVFLGDKKKYEVGSIIIPSQVPPRTSGDIPDAAYEPISHVAVHTTVQPVRAPRVKTTPTIPLDDRSFTWIVIVYLSNGS